MLYSQKLIEGIKNGSIGLKMLNPLIIHKDNNEYTDDVNKILKFDYRGEKNVAAKL